MQEELLKINVIYGHGKSKQKLIYIMKLLFWVEIIINKKTKKFYIIKMKGWILWKLKRCILTENG